MPGKCVGNRERDARRAEKALINSELLPIMVIRAYSPSASALRREGGAALKRRFADDDRAALEVKLGLLPERGYVDEPGRW
jgi:hypothetical protein